MNTPKLRDLVYSIPGAMKATNYSRDAIESAMAAGQVDVINLGKRRFISKVSIDRLVDEMLSAPKTTALVALPPTTTPTDPADALRLLECN